MSAHPLTTWQPFRPLHAPLSLDALAAAYAHTRPIKPDTARRVVKTLNNWARCLGHRPTVDDLDVEAINAWLASRHREPVRGGWVRRRYKSAAPATLRADLSRVRNLWYWAAELGLSDPPPEGFRKPPGRPKKRKPWWRRALAR